jgi:hypothetical protein
VIGKFDIFLDILEVWSCPNSKYTWKRTLVEKRKWIPASVGY